MLCRCRDGNVCLAVGPRLWSRLKCLNSYWMDCNDKTSMFSSGGIVITWQTLKLQFRSKCHFVQYFMTKYQNQFGLFFTSSAAFLIMLLTDESLCGITKFVSYLHQLAAPSASSKRPHHRQQGPHRLCNAAPSDNKVGQRCF